VRHLHLAHRDVAPVAGGPVFGGSGSRAHRRSQNTPTTPGPRRSQRRCPAPAPGRRRRRTRWPTRRSGRDFSRSSGKALGRCSKWKLPDVIGGHYDVGQHPFRNCEPPWTRTGAYVASAAWRRRDNDHMRPPMRTARSANVRRRRTGRQGAERLSAR
jgi:hypothetical protein